MVVHPAKALSLFVLLTVAAMGMAQTTVFEQDLETACLAQNPPSRMVWVFEITNGTPAPSRGAAVQSQSLGDGRYANCVQVDCVQSAFSTDPVFQYCSSDDKGLYKAYDVSYRFPQCVALYEERVSEQANSVCALCAPAQVQTAYSVEACQNGTQVLSRQVRTFTGPACELSLQKEFKYTSTPCGPDSSLFIIGALVLLGGAAVYYQRKGGK